jgi:hypothetical protein
MNVNVYIPHTDHAKYLIDILYECISIPHTDHAIVQIIRPMKFNQSLPLHISELKLIFRDPHFRHKPIVQIFE